MSDGHALFSPSSAHRWLRCPGSAVLVSRLPVREAPGAAAMLGTRIHLVAETLLKTQRMPAFAGAKEIAAAQPFVEHVRALARSRKGRVYVFAEEKLQLSNDCWGAADAVVWAPEEFALDIIDLKTGKLPVLPGGPQNRIYGGGALASFPTARHINGWIVQPKVYDKPVLETFEPWELTGLAELVKMRVDKGKNDTENALRPGDWCRYCPARATCPAVRDVLINRIPDGGIDDDTDYGEDFNY